jgi:hypothetical protein
MSEMSTLPIFLLLLLAWYASLFGNYQKPKYFLGFSFKVWAQVLLVMVIALILLGLFHDSTTPLSLSF